MKNYWHNKALNKKANLTRISFLVTIVMLFNVVFPALVFAVSEDSFTNTETSTEQQTENTDTESGTDKNSSIETGNAVSGTSIENEVNTNEINTNSTTSSDSLEDESELNEEESDNDNDISESDTDHSTSTNQTASTSPTSTSTATTTKEKTIDTTLEINATNTATSTNSATGTASTGSNTASTSNNTISTGDSIAYLDLVNVVNTNIVNSTGLIDFIRDILGYQDFDLRDTFFDIFNGLNTAESTAPCLNSICDPTSLLIDLINQAQIDNNIHLTANSGQNTAAGNGSISTGNAYASANIVNLANTNIIDSNYLLLVFNNFDDLSGSIVLPNSDFFTSLFPQKNNNGGNFSLNNSAEVTNSATTIADSGNNLTQGNGTSTIITGNSTATSYTENLINQNFLNSNNFSMLIRVHGSWSGDVFGLPEGMGWEDTGNGIRLFYNPEGSSGQSSQSNINITNDAKINNNVQVFALTGDNQINDSKDGVGHIQTGNAHADSTIVNIANTNIIGSNWVNLIFNIYGNWSGNLAFGQPDLWLGLKAEVDESNLILSGSKISYTYTVFNRGDSTAKNVILENKFPKNSLTFNDEKIRITNSNNSNTWSIGDIGVGQTKEITVTAQLNADFGSRQRLPLPLSVSVTSDQPDANPNDNKDSLILYVGQNQSGPSSVIHPASLMIEKSADKAYAKAGDVVNYTIKLRNYAGPIHDSVLFDVLKDKNGNVIFEEMWPLDTIKTSETITVTYSITITEGVLDDIFTNTAQLVGYHGSNIPDQQNVYESPTVMHKLQIIGDEVPEGEVLGLSTGVSTCEPYITTYLRQHKNNDIAEVIKLQHFLQNHVDNNVFVTSVFDEATRIAIKNFQQLYADEILTPWGMSQSSGYVYFTTQKKINEIMCGGLIDFPLSPEQEKEISFFRNNHNNINPTDWLFSSIENPNVNNFVQTENNTENTNQTQNHISFLKMNFPTTLKVKAFERLDGWLRLFNNHRTASR